jgi:Mn-dependent DtxR family transcriptional regulator
MTGEIWKQYEENSVTHSMGHYLMAIRDLLKARGYARVTDVATFLEVSRSSASTSLASLKKKGFVDEDENHFLRLSARGEAIALQIVRNHLILENFFRHILGVEEEQALVDACKMEHLLSPETSYRLLALIQSLENDEELKRRAIEGVTGQLCRDPEECPICSDSNPCPMDRSYEALKKNPI